MTNPDLFPLLEQRAALRNRALRLRESLPAGDVADWGVAIAERALEWVSDRRISTIFTYLDIPNEVPTHPLAAELLRRQVRIFVPRIVDSQTMTLHEIRDLERDLKRGLWGIRTPRLARTTETSAALIEAAFVPCVAVDAKGYRLGHGRGYYDRFLTANPHILPVGLAFEMQRVENIHPQSWDVPLTTLITESEVYEFPPD